jgi:hypothetical protein
MLPGIRAKKQRRRARLTDAGTRIALQLLFQYLEGFRNRSHAAKALLQCSDRSAKRLTSLKTPYRGRMRAEWGEVICAAVGQPAAVLYERKKMLFPTVLRGWAYGLSPAQEVFAASELAASVAVRALHYDLHGATSVVHCGDGVAVCEVGLWSARAGSPPHILRFFPRQEGRVARMWMTYKHPSVADAVEQRVTSLAVDLKLEFIAHETKRYDKSAARGHSR